VQRHLQSAGKASSPPKFAVVFTYDIAERGDALAKRVAIRTASEIGAPHPM
jgi:hypothetical protein